MIYRIQGSLMIRTLEERDCAAFPQGFLAQGWHKPESQFQAYLQEQAEALASSLASVLTLGVGLHWGYGQAQHLYIRRGYQFITSLRFCSGIFLFLPLSGDRIDQHS